MSGRRGRLLAACAVTRGERIARGVMALVLAAAAASLWPTALAGGIAAAIAAAVMAVMAATGFCPSRYLHGAPLPQGDTPELLREHEVADARSLVDLKR